MNTKNDIKNPTIGEIKRFLELYCADKTFRDMLYKDSYKAVKMYDMDIDPEEIRVIWDVDFAKEQDKINAPLNPTVQKYRDFNIDKIQWREEVKKECSPDNKRFKIWRDRGIARCSMQLGENLNEKLIHTPLSFELADGCTVGCKFCGLDAPPFKDVFLYTKENEKLWKDILGVAKDILGNAARWGTCYFATEPMDNPDYEKFCIDFGEILGKFPQTTTALPVKDIDRTHRLLKLAKEKGSKVDRFSILSLGILKKVHEEFSADELTSVELLVQNPESNMLKSATGRFYKKIKENPELANDEIRKFYDVDDESKKENIPELPATISCISGFVVNMVTKTCKLISPWAADDRWPQGLVIYDSGTFTDAVDFKKLLENMIEKNMRISVEELEVVRLRRGLKLSFVPEGFEIIDKYRKLMFKNEEKSEYLKSLGEYIIEGNKNATDIALLLFYKFGLPEANTIATLNLCFKYGAFDEEPQEK